MDWTWIALVLGIFAWIFILIGLVQVSSWISKKVRK